MNLHSWSALNGILTMSEGCFQRLKEAKLSFISLPMALIILKFLDMWSEKVRILKSIQLFQVHVAAPLSDLKRMHMVRLVYGDSQNNSDIPFFISVRTVCLFVCLFVFFVPLENFSFIWRRHHCWWRASNVDLCSALMAIRQWGFFSVPHLLWHGASVYNGHLRGPVTLTSIAERLAVELSLPVFTTYVCRGWDTNTQPSACEANALAYCATAAVIKNWLTLKRDMLW